MPAYSIRNENFRDEVIKFSYPFDEQSALEDNSIFLGPDLFIDAVFYLKTEVTLPIYISIVDGTYGTLDEVLFVFADKTGQTVGSAVISYIKAEATVYNAQQVPIGAIVLNPGAVDRFIGSVVGKVFPLLSSVAAFLIDTCHVAKTPHLRYVEVGEEALDDVVKIVARHGCRFRLVDGVLCLDLIGSPAADTDRSPVRSINGVRSRSIWLQGHPRANLRISNADNKITFIQAKDAV